MRSDFRTVTRQLSGKSFPLPSRAMANVPDRLLIVKSIVILSGIRIGLIVREWGAIGTIRSEEQLG